MAANGIYDRTVPTMQHEHIFLLFVNQFLLEL